MLARLGLLIGLFLSPCSADETVYQVIEVRPGDTLWAIAHRYLKDPAQWSEIVAHNPKIGADPTVVLPGVKIRVPIGILKPVARAAKLTHVESEVSYRPRLEAEWTPAKLDMALYPDNWLKTGELSRARIKFPFGEVLNLESHSLVIIDPPNDAGQADLRLMEGKLKALNLKLKAQDVEVVPTTKTAVFELAVENGVVKVDVYAGLAEIRARGAAVKVQGGQTVSVPKGGEPRLPTKFVPPDETTRKVMANRQAAEKAGRETATDLGEMEVDLKDLPVGMTVAAFRLQASQTPDFSVVALERTFQSDEKITLKNIGLTAGVYWWRVAPVDLLGVSGKFSQPKRSVLH